MYSIMKETSKIKEPGHGSETVLLKTALQKWGIIGDLIIFSVLWGSRSFGDKDGMWLSIVGLQIDISSEEYHEGKEGIYCLRLQYINVNMAACQICEHNWRQHIGQEHMCIKFKVSVLGLWKKET